MIPYNPKTEPCPYGTEEMRERWHRERGIEDPGKKVVRKERMEDPVLNKSSETVELQAVPIKESKSTRDEKERVRLAEYRARNREELAAKARERRAKKKEGK